MGGRRISKYEGLRFGRLTVISLARIHKSHSVWRCICTCGNETEALQSHLARGGVRSCGCLKKEELADRVSKHKMTNSKEYSSWCGMKYRCHNPKCRYYKNYGGRGIIVCDKWLNSFESFIDDMGPMPEGKYSLDRIDVNGNYEPTNCRWATDHTQGRNRRNNHWIEYQDKRMITADWAKFLGLDLGYFYGLLKKKSIEEIYNNCLKRHGALPYQK